MEKKSRRKYVITVGIILGIGLLLAGAVEYTSHSRFCITCHEMKPSYTSWQSSSHRSVECKKCHFDPGVTGLIKTKVRALYEVYAHIAGNFETPVRLKYGKAAALSSHCLGCHQEIRGKDKAHNNAHFEQDINCTECHKGLVHYPKTNNSLPTGQVCVKCHGTGAGQFNQTSPEVSYL